MKFSYKCICEKGIKGFTVGFEIKKCIFCNKETIRKTNKRYKYGNVWTWCQQGHKHQSKGEAGYCNALYQLKKKLRIKEIEQQKTFELYTLEGKKRKHKVDFFVTYEDGHQEVHEFKGKETRDWKIKKDLFKIKYPNIEYKVVKK